MVKAGAGTKPPASSRGLWHARPLMAAALAVGVAVFWFARPYWNVASKTSELTQLVDSQLEPQLRAIVAEGKPGLEALVAALNSERAALSIAAFRILSEELDAWRAAGDLNGERRFDQLAQAVAGQSPQFNSEALRLAAALAEQLVALPAGASQRSAARLRNCHIVLAAQARLRIRNLNSPVTKNAIADTEAAKTVSPTRKPLADPLASFAPPLAGGGLPVSPAGMEFGRLPQDLMAEARPLENAKPATQSANTPLRFKPLVTAESTASDVPRPVAIIQSVGSAANEEVDDDYVAEPIPTIVKPVLPQPSSGKTVEAAQPDSLAKLLAVDKRARSDNQEIATAAKEEMARRGIDEAQLRLARGAIDPDPHVRMQLVEALTVLDVVDSRRWLVWLSYDEIADVRRAAISLLATSSDPELKKRVRQAAQTDADPRVREQARSALGPPGAR